MILLLTCCEIDFTADFLHGLGWLEMGAAKSAHPLSVHGLVLDNAKKAKVPEDGAYIMSVLTG